MKPGRLGTNPLEDLPAGAVPGERKARPVARRKATSRRAAVPGPPATPAAIPSSPPVPPPPVPPPPTGRSLTTLEATFDEVLTDMERRIAVEAGLGAGSRRRLEQERRLFGERMAERVGALRTGDDRDREALAVIRSLLTFERVSRLASRRWLADRSLVVDAFGFDPREAARLEPLVRWLVDRWFRVEVEGVESVPAEGRAILVANHAGAIPFDGLVITHLVRRAHPGRDVRWLAEDEAHHFPFFGPLMSRLGSVRACPENARLLLEREAALAVFPEGNAGLRKSFRHRYRLQRFGRGGVVKLALRTGSPVIPVAAVGGEETYPVLARTRWFTEALGVSFLPITPLFPWLGPLGLLPLPSRWCVRFGAPLDLGLPAAAADDPAAVSRVNERIRGVVQGMVGELLARRGAVFW